MATKRDEKGGKDAKVSEEKNPPTTEVETRGGGIGTVDPGLANNQQEVDSSPNPWPQGKEPR